MSNTLLPCPFCGGEAESKMYLWGHHAETKAPIWCYYVYCVACDATTDNVFKSKEDAGAAWNRRAQPENKLLAHTVEYERIRAEVETWPQWKIDVYNWCIATSAHAKKIAPENKPLTLDEIVRALKCCSRVDAQCNGCDGCPFEYCGPECDLLCKNAATLIESMQSQLADYHHMSKLVDGKMGENQRLRRINENLQEQLNDAVPVVRCGECKNFSPRNLVNFCSRTGRTCENNDFCSYGAKMEDKPCG